MKAENAQIIVNQVVGYLRDERIRRGISQYRMAKDTGLSKMTIFRIERLEQNPAASTLYVIAQYLDLDIGDIFKKVNN